MLSKKYKAMGEWNKFLTGAERSLFSQAINHQVLVDRIMLELPDGASVLEAGCGMAYLSQLLANKGYVVSAGDIDEEVLTSAANGVNFAGNPVKFYKLDLLHLSDQFKTKEFDAIIHSGVMEHFSDKDIVHSLKEQYKISGKIIFKVPNIRTKMNSGHFGDERFMSNKKWIELIKKAGFSSVRVYGGDSVPVWSRILPAVCHMTPKKGYGERKNHYITMLGFWRVYISRHSIFVCS